MNKEIQTFFTSFNLSWPSVFKFVFLAIAAGFLAKLGEKVFEEVLSFFPSLLELFKGSLLYPIPIKINLQITPLVLVFAVLFIFIIYRLSNKRIKIKRPKIFGPASSEEIVFFEDFKNDNNKWTAPYWPANPKFQNTITRSDGYLVIVADAIAWPTRNNTNGACFDLRKGIEEGKEYEVTCRVKSSSASTTMQFQLWVHDTDEGHNVTSPDGTFVSLHEVDYHPLKLRFIGTHTKALRIHLHCKAGTGKIIVKDVTVTKL